MDLDPAKIMLLAAAAAFELPPPEGPPVQGSPAELFHIAAMAAAYHSAIHSLSPSIRLQPYSAILRLMEAPQFRLSPRKPFARELTLFPPGTLVKLRDGRWGRVKKVRTDLPTRPKIEILDDQIEDAGAPFILDLRDAPTNSIISAPSPGERW